MAEGFGRGVIRKVASRVERRCFGKIGKENDIAAESVAVDTNIEFAINKENDYRFSRISRLRILRFQ